MKRRGFTLAELLIALAILGVIATFTIPKVLSTSEDAERKAVFKETIAALENVLYNGLLLHEINEGTCNNGTYFLDKLNAVIICPANSSTQGCWNTAVQGALADNDHTRPGVVLSNGVTLVGLNNECDATGGPFTVDWNGEGGPNTFSGAGNDQIKVRICDQYGINDLSCEKQGTVRPDTAAHEDLYIELFSR